MGSHSGVGSRSVVGASRRGCPVMAWAMVARRCKRVGCVVETVASCEKWIVDSPGHVGRAVKLPSTCERWTVHSSSMAE